MFSCRIFVAEAGARFRPLLREGDFHLGAAISFSRRIGSLSMNKRRGRKFLLRGCILPLLSYPLFPHIRLCVRFILRKDNVKRSRKKTTNLTWPEARGNIFYLYLSIRDISRHSKYRSLLSAQIIIRQITREPSSFFHSALISFLFHFLPERFGKFLIALSRTIIGEINVAVRQIGVLV